MLLISSLTVALADPPQPPSMSDCETLGFISCSLREDCVSLWRPPPLSTAGEERSQPGMRVVGTPGEQFMGCEALPLDVFRARRETRRLCEEQGGTWVRLDGGRHVRCRCPIQQAELGHGVWIEGLRCTSEAAYCGELGGSWHPPSTGESGRCLREGRRLNLGWHIFAQPPAAEVLQRSP